MKILMSIQCHLWYNVTVDGWMQHQIWKKNVEFYMHSHLYYTPTNISKCHDVQTIYLPQLNGTPSPSTSFRCTLSANPRAVRINCSRGGTKVPCHKISTFVTGFHKRRFNYAGVSLVEFHLYDTNCTFKSDKNDIGVGFKLYSTIDGLGIYFEITLKLLLLDRNNDKATYIQSIAWCRQATAHCVN